MLQLDGTGISPGGRPLVLLLRTGVLRPLRDTWPENTGVDEPPTDLTGHRQHPGGQGLLSDPCSTARCNWGKRPAARAPHVDQATLCARALKFPFLKGCFCPKPLAFYGNNLMDGIPRAQGSAQGLASRGRTQALADPATWQRWVLTVWVHRGKGKCQSSFLLKAIWTWNEFRCQTSLY